MDVSVGLGPTCLVEEGLNSLEQLKPVLLHDDRVRAFRQHHVSLAGRVHEQRKQRLRHIGWQISIPFGLHEQRWDSDLGGIVVDFPGGPVILAVLNYAVRWADIGRICLRAFGIGHPSRVRPGVEPSGRDQAYFLSSGTPVIKVTREQAMRRWMTGVPDDKK